MECEMLSVDATKKDRSGQTAHGFAECAICGKSTITRPSKTTGVIGVANVRDSTDVLEMSLRDE